MGGTGEPEVELKDSQDGVAPFNPDYLMPNGAVIANLELVVRRQVKFDFQEVTFADALASVVGSPDEIIVRGGKGEMNRITVSQKSPLSYEAAVQNVARRAQPGQYREGVGGVCKGVRSAR